MKRLFPLILLAIAPLKAQTQAEKYWLPSVTFSAESFAHPAPQFAPFTRWWLPGNDITPEELKREINLFADNHFGGVEIQPFRFSNAHAWQRSCRPYNELRYSCLLRKHQANAR